MNQQSQNQINGADTSLSVRSEGPSRNRRTYVKFDLSACSVPGSARVTTATLKLYMWSAPVASRTHEVWRVTSAWAQGTLKWSSQPSAAGSATASATTGTVSGVWLSWNVTGDVQTWVGGTTNNGWRVNDQPESSATAQDSAYRSRESTTSSQRPQLYLTYYP
ncbi:MAG: DNRLRE domain-containing protein [Actinobacteria bacterium]|nr:DNRLRE domain-containing protein [Actinomycetota bacterium]